MIKGVLCHWWVELDTALAAVIAWLKIAVQQSKVVHTSLLGKKEVSFFPIYKQGTPTS